MEPSLFTCVDEGGRRGGRGGRREQHYTHEHILDEQGTEHTKGLHGTNQCTIVGDSISLPCRGGALRCGSVHLVGLLFTGHPTTRTLRRTGGCGNGRKLLHLGDGDDDPVTEPREARAVDPARLAQRGVQPERRVCEPAVLGPAETEAELLENGVDGVRSVARDRDARVRDERVEPRGLKREDELEAAPATAAASGRRGVVAPCGGRREGGDDVVDAVLIFAAELVVAGELGRRRRGRQKKSAWWRRRRRGAGEATGGAYGVEG